MKAKIRVGSNVTQDFHFFKWPKELANTIFDISDLQNGVWNVGNYKCVAPGFGELNGNYGNGAVYTSIKNLEIVDKEGASLRFTNQQRTLIFDAGT